MISIASSLELIVIQSRREREQGGVAANIRKT